jgi:hypothetical protein
VAAGIYHLLLKYMDLGNLDKYIHLTMNGGLSNKGLVWYEDEYFIKKINIYY